VKGVTLLSVPRLVLIICALAALAAGTLATTAGARGATIKVGDDFFSPKEKTVAAGTKVKFNWIGNDEHDVVKKKGPGGDFSSGPLEGSGVLYKHKFKKTGTYKIICTIHDGMKMKLHVT
jgi:plastocyanin